MDSIDFVKFCEAANNANIDVADIRSRVYKINNKLQTMRSSGQRTEADAAARSAIFIIRDMTYGLVKFGDESPLVALTGAIDILGALLPKLANLGKIKGDFIGLAAAIFSHFNQGKPHSIDKVFDACIEQSKQFITDTELISHVLKLIDIFTHQKVFLASMVPNSITDEEVVGVCLNVPIHQEMEALHLIEDRVKHYFVRENWRNQSVDDGFTFIRLYAQLVALRLIIMCCAYDVINHATAFSSVAKGYRSTMMSYIDVAQEMLNFFKTGECFALTSCIGPVEWPSIYSFLALTGIGHSQCGDWVFIEDQGIPPKALSVGRGRLGGEDIYIGRTEFREELIVGKIYGRKMYWTSDGIEYTTTNVKEYEILCLTDDRVHALWKTIGVGGHPEEVGAYRAGRSPYGEAYYVGRMKYMNDWVVGKVYGGYFFFSVYGSEVAVSDPTAFEVLCLGSR